MYKELIVNVTGHETRVALLEDKSVVEFFIEKGEDSNIGGNIYKGRVQRVLPGMQASFVDIGLNQAAFLYVDDVITQQNLDEGEAPPESRADNDTNLNNKHDLVIEKMLKEGHEIMVQIAKSPIGGKGARVTSYISLPGRYLVLMPNVDHIGVSKRIDNEEERERLRSIVREARPVNYGFILRTSAEGVDGELIKKEVVMLVNSWEAVKKKYRESRPPSILHRDLTVTFRAIRDLVTQEAEKVVIDSRFGYQAILKYLNKILPEFAIRVECYDRPEPIFEYYRVEGAISRALKKKVWLKSGSFIVIEHTEALTSIDVNTGRFVGSHNFEETILKTNLEALKEIAYQIRLRNIGGIIVIDFIDMESHDNRNHVFTALKEIFEHDKCKTKILPMSEIGLIQMTRKRVRKSMNSCLCEPCRNCFGDGYVLARNTVAQKIYREIGRHSADMMGDEFVLKVSADMAAFLHQEETGVLRQLETRTGKKINVFSETGLHREEFELTEKIVSQEILTPK